MRDDFSQMTKDTLGRRVSYRCSNPRCPLPTVGPHTDGSKSVNKGVAAHISAASPGGKRYDVALTAEERRDIGNGIWLCQNCAKLIDSDEQRYTAELLTEWKAKAEFEALQSLESNSPLSEAEVGEPDIRVRASYAGGPKFSLVQFSVFNADSKPIYLSSWFANCDDRSSTVSLTCVNGTLPFRLQDQDYHQIVVDVGKNSLANVEEMGIVDGSGRWWHVPNVEVARIKEESRRYSSLKPERDTSELEKLMKGCRVQITVVIKDVVYNHKQLEVHFTNDSELPIQLTGAEIKWKYDPPRASPRPEDSGGISVQQIGGSIRLHNASSIKSPTVSGGKTIFVVDSDPAGALVETLFDDVKDEGIEIVVYTNTKSAWTATMDEIPDTVRSFARYLVQNG